MSDYKLLNYCILFSIAFHIFMFNSVINLKVISPIITTLNTVELVIIKDILPDFSVSGLTDFSPLNANLSKSLPHRLESGKILKTADLPNFNKNTYLRGGETSKFESMLPLQSLPEKTNLDVSFSDKQYYKVVPDFSSNGLDLLSGDVLAQEIGTIATKPITAAIFNSKVNKQKHLATINKGDLSKKYQKEFLERIRSVIFYPGWAQSEGILGRVILEVSIKRNGKVSNIEVHKTSGNSRLDEEAIKLVTSIGSFPEFPKELEGNQLTMHLPVTYNLI